MKEFWAERSEREHILIILALVVFTVGVCYFFIITPLGQWRDAAAGREARAEAFYALVAEVSESGISEREAIGERERNTPLRNTLMQTARTNEITLSFVNRRTDGSIEVSAEQSNPENLFLWMRELDERYAIQIITADIAQANDQGSLVRAQLVFQRMQ